MITFAAIGGDEPRQHLREREGKLLFATTTTALIIAACSYGIGVQSASERTAEKIPASALDQSRSVAELQLAREKASPAVPWTNRSDRRSHQDGANAPVKTTTRAATENGKGKISSGTKYARSSQKVALRVSHGAHADMKQSSSHAIAPPKGMVRFGRFDSDSEGKKEWTDMVRRWPDMQGLSVVAVQIKSLRDGKAYYRLQLGTTSPANSEVVCKRAHDLDQSCSIIAADGHAAESPL